MTAFERVREVVAATLGVAPRLVREDTTRDDLDGWDSLGHINLIVALEGTFDVAFDVEDVARLTSVPAILAGLSTRGIT